MPPRDGDPRSPRAEPVQLVEDAGAAADRRRHRGAGHAQLGERPQAEDEARAEHDVDDVREPEHPHRDRGVARAAEDGVDEEQQQDVTLPPSITLV